MSVVVKWGIIGALGLISSFSVHFSTYNPLEEGGFGKIFFLTAFLLLAFTIFFGLMSIQKSNPAAFTLEMGLKSGLKIVLIASLINTIYLYIFFSWINPSILEQFYNINFVNMQKMLDANEMSKDVFDEQVAGIRAFYKPFNQSSMTLMITLFIGSFFTLLSTIMLRTIGRK